ncbi:MAG: hypothetical protein ACYC3S_03555 [Chloroflexota bacterium]
MSASAAVSMAALQEVTGILQGEIDGRPDLIVAHQDEVVKRFPRYPKTVYLVISACTDGH